MVERRLGAANSRVGAGDLPLPPGVVRRLADLPPKETGRVRSLDHPIAFAVGPVFLFEQRPDVVEQIDAELLLALRLERDGCWPGRHGKYRRPFVRFATSMPSAASELSATPASSASTLDR